MRVVHLQHWSYFDDYITEKMIDRRQFIWRGQASAAWLLESTLDRLLKRREMLQDRNVRDAHLQRFKLAARGRRGANPSLFKSDNDWWALGQHFGLATPLLDWTTSPYVAAYFAFVAEDCDGAERRAVFGVSRNAIRVGSDRARTQSEGSGRMPIVEVVEPLMDENSRLVSQGGLFTRAPDATDVEAWIRKYFESKSKTTRLVKITIPNSDRELALRSLNRMNINHLSLFPDLYGASKFANLDLTIDDY